MTNARFEFEHMNDNLERAVRIIKKGGIVIFPTDTAFGIGCRIDDMRAVRKLFEIRKRPLDKAVPVLASSIEMVESYVEKIKPDVRDLMKKYWPGGLTLVMKCKKNRVSSLVRGGGDTIGVRIPAHDSALRVIRALGVPVVGSSANFAGGQTPFKVSELDSELVGLVDFVLPGRCSMGRVSTVLDVTKTPWKILRKGALRIT